MTRAIHSLVSRFLLISGENCVTSKNFLAYYQQLKSIPTQQDIPNKKSRATSRLSKFQLSKKFPQLVRYHHQQTTIKTMSPAILLSTPSDPENRPKKRVKWASLPPEEESIPADAIPPHPLGLKPGGNAYTSPTNSKSKMGIFRCLPDEMLMGVLEILEAGDLMRVGGSCRQFYAFARAEELWRSLFVA